MQRSINNPININGITLHSDKLSNIELCPAEANTGIFLNEGTLSCN